MCRLLLFALFVLFTLHGSTQQLTTANLRCEESVAPLGVESKSPRLSWEIQSAQRNVLQTAYRIIVADNLNAIEKNTGNIWDSKMVNSSASIQVKYRGKALKPATTYYWKVMLWDNRNNVSKWSAAASWQMGLLAKADWKKARWIAYEDLPDSNKIIPAAHGKGKKEWGIGKNILPLLRKEFTVEKKIKKATVFISGLGHFDMMVNGKKLGDHFLDPGWTKYDKEAQYVTFDATALLRQGSNAVGVMLGNGFYYQPRERYRKITGAFGYPKMICRIAVDYTDGSVKNIVSDETWKATPGPVIFSSIYSGEDYDANLEQPGWDAPAFNDTKWKNAIEVKGSPALVSQMAEPLKIFDQFSPKKLTPIKPGLWVYDLGQNASGIPRITVSGRKGDTVRIRPAELINEDGTANQKGTGGPSYFTYILKGQGKESWQPQFTYYGFRYLQVEGAVPDTSANPKNLPAIYSVTGLHTRNAAKTVGDFSCSNELFNQTNKLIGWAIKSNMVSVFTDCPHREKLGWLEETHLMGSSVRYNYDIATLCRKAIRDMMVSQTAEGLIPEIAPEFVQFEEPFRDSPEWGSAGILLPWYVYEWYGDRQIVEESYPMMQKYISYLQSKANDHILTQGLGDWYDLGPNHPGVSQLTPKGVTATAFYYYDLTIIAAAARLLNKMADAKKYDSLALLVKAAFNEAFFNKETKQYATGSQAANAVAVYMKLVTPEDKAAVVENMVKEIRGRNNSLTAGDIGYRYLLRVLDDEGRSDVIFDMNSRDDVPGYGYQLAHGATALTESWQAMPSVSNNHFMLGHLEEWFYSGLAGIRPAAGSIAFHTIDIRPEIVGNVTSAAANYHSPYGLISSKWEKKVGHFDLQVTIPANTTATVYLPAGTAANITEGGKPVNKTGELQLIKFEKGKALIKLGSGNYHFTVK